MIKYTKSEVNYRQGTDYERCQLCKYFKLPHSCTKVSGRILHTDLCNLYEQGRTPFEYDPDDGGKDDGDSSDS